MQFLKVKLRVGEQQCPCPRRSYAVTSSPRLLHSNHYSHPLYLRHLRHRQLMLQQPPQPLRLLLLLPWPFPSNHPENYNCSQSPLPA